MTIERMQPSHADLIQSQELFGANTLDTAQFSPDGALNVMDFGAKGDGVTDDSAAIQAAINAAMANGKQLRFPGGTYVVGRSVSNVTGRDIDIVFEASAIIDGRSSAAAYLITLGGTAGADTSLSKNADKGAKSILVPGHGLVAGDIFRIQSTDLWNPTRPYYYRGEICRVYAVSGDTVYVETPLYDSYVAHTTKVCKYMAGKCRIEGMRILRNSNQAGLQLQYVRDYRLSRVDIQGANERCLYLLECFNGVVDSACLNGKYYPGASTAYGLSIGSCQHLRIQSGYFVGGRHGIAIGGTFPVRDVKVFGANVNNDDKSRTFSLDSHGNAEFIEFYGCHVHNGAALQAINVRVIGGEYRATTAAAALWFIPEISGSYIEARSVYALNHAGLTGVSVVLYHDALTFDTVTLDGITVETVPSTVAGTVGLVNVSLNNPAWSGSIRRLTIANVRARFLASPSSIGYVIAVGANSNLTADVDLYDNEAIGPNLNVRSLYVKVDGTIRSRGNRYIGGDPASYSGVVIAGDFYSDSDEFDGGGSALYLYLSTSGKISLRNGYLKGMTHPVGGIYAPNATDIRYSNMEKIDVNGDFNGTLTRPYMELTDAGTRVLYRIVPPEIGSWGIGDRTVNSRPAVGQPKAWVCTAEGTPGTWVSEGNL
ncbi:hypothetical protein C5O80_31150 [Burkholderia sp. SRS-46]|nr:hypothetical protein C5O80_31150 [Burkholderia sp. SRS-46]